MLVQYTLCSIASYTYVDATPGEEGDTTLRVGRLVLAQELKLVVLVLVVANVSVTLASKVQAVGAIVPERHADAGYRVNHGEAANGLGLAGLPEGYLALAHLGEASGGEAVVLAHPDGPAVLGAGVAGCLVDGLVLAHVPDANLLVARRGDEHAAGRIP